jgi:hypothetical protein
VDSVVTALVQNVGGKTLKKMNSTATGTVEHAVIAFLDCRDRQVQEKESDDQSFSVSSITSKVTSKIKETANSIAPNVTSFVSGMLEGADMGKDVKKYEVQFNPESLKITAAVNDKKNVTSLEENKQNVQYSSNEATYSLSVQLIFDESNSIIQTEGKVQKEVEGFISAISSENTRALVFMWGNINYEGILDNVEATYTMFDSNGIPIRANMNLSISCCSLFDGSAVSEERPLGAWQSAYDELIGSDGNFSCSDSKNIEKAMLCITNLSSSNQQSSATQAATTAEALSKAFTGGTSGKNTQQSGLKVLTVQFNPNEISFSSSPQEEKKGDNTKVDKVLTQPFKTIMTVSLIFEEIHNTDAFIWDKQNAVFRGSLKEKLQNSSLVSAIKDYSVKNQIDGILALLANRLTRNVVFNWGKQSVTGVLQSAEAEYTMFNTSGNPIMGSVTLKIGVTSFAKQENAFDGLFKVKHSNVMESVSNTASTISQLVKFNK